MDPDNRQFTNFKIHTQYSICEGAARIDDLSDFCKENKLKALGICDSFNLCGALEFSDKISKAGTQPIIGSQINFIHGDLISKIPIFAKSEIGFKNLTNLSSKSYVESDEKSLPHCKIDDLINHNEDLIILTGGLHDYFGNLFKINKNKELIEIIKKLKQVFNDRLYIEIQRHFENEEKSFEKFMLNLSKIENIPIIASQEVYYIQKNMAEAHDALICIKNKNFVDDKNRIKLSDEHYLKKSEDLNSLFSDLPEALKNNFNFPYRFNFKLKKSKPILPSLNTTKQKSANLELKEQANEGLNLRLKNYIFKRKKNLSEKKVIDEYKKRLDHELNIINSMDYSSYFLIVSDYIKWSKKNSIPVGPGRGSGAGSLVAYCLDITDLDPIEFDLIFERFLNQIEFPCLILILIL